MKLNSRIRKVLCLLLVLTMVLTFVPMAGFAADDSIGSGTPDGTPPVLHDITLSVTTVKAPGTIEVTADASDDVSGVSGASVYFKCEETGKTLYAHLNGTYWDSTLGERVPYADGKFHGSIEIGQYVLAGNFKISSASVTDAAGNSKHYGQYQTAFPDAVKNLQFTVTDEDVPDAKPPVLNAITLEAASVQAPGTIAVTLDATDDVSGVSGASVYFKCEETGKTLYAHLNGTYWDSALGERIPYADGKFHGTIEIGQYVLAGNFKISSASVTDAAGNSKHYGQYQTAFPDAVNNLQFTVIESDTPDGTPPVLENIKLTVNTMTAPGTIEVTLDASDDVSGVSGASVYFKCEETGKTLYAHLNGTFWDSALGERVPYADGKFHGTIEIGQYVLAGNFKISSASVTDAAGNSKHYGQYQTAFPDAVKNLQFTVLNSVPDVTTSVSKSEFVDQLENAGDNAYIAADYSGDATMPKEAFEAIAGTDKTLDLISEGITWRFNGSDITEEIKDIDLKVDIQQIENDGSASGEAIEEALKGNPGVVMKFPENGTLPGKATIQVKVDYAMREYLKTSNSLCVYYYNNQTGKLELIAENLTVINDTYVEFPITHCSYYVLTPYVQTEEEPDQLYGDVNGNGVVDSDDAALICYYDAELIPATELLLAVGDVTGDGYVDSDDAALICYMDAELIDYSDFPCFKK